MGELTLQRAGRAGAALCTSGHEKTGGLVAKVRARKWGAIRNAEKGRGASPQVADDCNFRQPLIYSLPHKSQYSPPEIFAIETTNGRTQIPWEGRKGRAYRERHGHKRDWWRVE